MKSLYLAIKSSLARNSRRGVFITRPLIIKSCFTPTNFTALPAITFSFLTSLDPCSNHFTGKSTAVLTELPDIYIT